jgi:hypothetical protein
MTSPSLHVIASVAFPLLCFSLGSAAEIPLQARKIIQQVHAASAKKDLSALSRLMVRDFQWSFGGDRDVQQALDAWKANPSYLRNLRRVTGQQCDFRTPETIQCPVKAGVNFRAGFEKAADG